MTHLERNRPVRAMECAEWAHQRATVGGMGDVAIYMLMRSCNVMMSARLGRLLEPHSLTSFGFITMMALYSRVENLANPSELCEATGETRSNMTRICDALAARGLIRRVSSAEDRRRVDVSLTDKGVALLNELLPWLRQNADGFYRRTFTEIEKATLKRLLVSLATGLAAET